MKKKEPIEEPKTQNAEIGALEQLLDHPGWKVIRKHLQANLEFLTARALDDSDEALKELSTPVHLTERELLIKWRKYNELLLNLPENLILSLKIGAPIEAPTEHDPYWKEADLVGKAKA